MTQTTMTLEACCRCGQPIAPGEPAMQTASVDLDMNGRAVSSPVKAYHLTGRCYEDARAAQTARLKVPARSVRRWRAGTRPGSGHLVSLFNLAAGMGLLHILLPSAGEPESVETEEAAPARRRR